MPNLECKNNAICCIKCTNPYLQILGYVTEPTRNEDALRYWRSNKHRFPILAKAVHKYLGSPCTSVDSKRLFSAASHIVDEKRNRLS